MGGFLARKGDGSPWLDTIWRGWQRLETMIQGIMILKATQPKIKNKMWVMTRPEVRAPRAAPSRALLWHPTDAIFRGEADCGEQQQAGGSR